VAGSRHVCRSPAAGRGPRIRRLPSATSVPSPLFQASKSCGRGSVIFHTRSRRRLPSGLCRIARRPGGFPCSFAASCPCSDSSATGCTCAASRGSFKPAVFRSSVRPVQRRPGGPVIESVRPRSTGQAARASSSWWRASPAAASRTSTSTTARPVCSSFKAHATASSLSAARSRSRRSSRRPVTRLCSALS
jgi:hypothetical protein